MKIKLSKRSIGQWLGFWAILSVGIILLVCYRQFYYWQQYDVLTALWYALGFMLQIHLILLIVGFFIRFIDDSQILDLDKKMLMLMGGVLLCLLGWSLFLFGPRSLGPWFD